MHHVLDCGENIFLVDPELARLLEIIRKDIEEELRIRVGVDMSVCVCVQELLELTGIGKVPIVAKNNTIGAIHIERLRLCVS